MVIEWREKGRLWGKQGLPVIVGALAAVVVFMIFAAVIDASDKDWVRNVVFVSFAGVAVATLGLAWWIDSWWMTRAAAFFTPAVAVILGLYEGFSPGWLLGLSWGIFLAVLPTAALVRHDRVSGVFAYPLLATVFSGVVIVTAGGMGLVTRNGSMGQVVSGLILLSAGVAALVLSLRNDSEWTTGGIFAGAWFSFVGLFLMMFSLVWPLLLIILLGLVMIVIGRRLDRPAAVVAGVMALGLFPFALMALAAFAVGGMFSFI